MFQEINSQLKNAKDGIDKYNDIDAMLRKLRNKSKIVSESSDELKEMIERKERKLRKLRNGGIASHIAAMFLDLESKAEEEAKVLTEAEQKYEKKKKELEEIEDAIEKLDEDKKLYINSEVDYKNLYFMKKEQMLSENTDESRKLKEYINAMPDLQRNYREIGEAISVGKKIISCLNNASGDLDGAAAMGAWDMAGGDFAASAARMAFVEDANDDIQSATRLLKDFKSEIADIKIEADMDLDANRMFGVMDLFSDNIAFDLMAQVGIWASQDNVSNIKREVQDVLSKLEKLNQEVKYGIIRLERKIDDLIINAE